MNTLEVINDVKKPLKKPSDKVSTFSANREVLQYHYRKVNSKNLAHSDSNLKSKPTILKSELKLVSLLIVIIVDRNKLIAVGVRR